MRAAAGLLAAALTGCASLPDATMAPDALAAMKTQPQRLIVIAVANPDEGGPAAVASSTRYPETRYAAAPSAERLLERLSAEYGLRPLAAWPIAALALDCAVMAVPDAGARDAILARLAADRRVALAQPLQEFGTQSQPYNDPYFGLQHGLASLRAAEVHRWTRGKGVRVAIIDTGVDAAHPDLAGRVVLERNFVDADDAQFARDRHGTEVAGVIAAVPDNHLGIVGVAPEAELLALKACWEVPEGDSAARCNTFTLAQALSAAIDAGAAVVNLSLAGPMDPLLSRLTQRALDKHIIVVGALAAAGEPGFPGGVRGVIPVDMADGAGASPPAVHAPGRNILTLTPAGHFDFVSGSSMAAAHISGVVALLLALDPALDGSSVAPLLTAPVHGEGGVDLCDAVATLRPGDACAPSPAAPAARLAGGAAKPAPAAAPDRR